MPLPDPVQAGLVELSAAAVPPPHASSTPLVVSEPAALPRMAAAGAQATPFPAPSEGTLLSDFLPHRPRPSGPQARLTGTGAARGP